MKQLPEAELLISCCRENASSDLQNLEACAGKVKNWVDLVRISDSHKIAPLVLPLFKKLADGGHVPEFVVNDLSAIARSNVAAHMHFRLALKELLPALRSYSVPVIVMKGLAIGSLLYDKPDVRPCGDIDLLCKEEDFQTVHDCLQSLGYMTEDGSSLPPRHSHEETHFERNFVHPQTRVHIELHVDEMKLGVRPKHAGSIWDRVRTVRVDGNDVLALSLEDQVLSLSVHLHRHGFNRLIWFKDMDLLLRKFGTDLDWEQVVREAKLEGAESSLWYTFHFLKSLLDTPIPVDVVSRLKPNPLIRGVYRMIWPQSNVMNLSSVTKRRAVQFSKTESWRGMMPSLLLMGRRRDKMSILLRRMLPI